MRLRLVVGALAALSLTAAGAPPQRIVTLAPHLAELVCAVGACDRLVGVSARSDYPPPVRALPQVGDGFSVNLEAVLIARPDLVLAWDLGTPKATIERLRGLGLPVTVIRADTLDAVADALRQVGVLTGHAAAGAEAARDYRAALAARRARYARAAPIRVFYQLGTAPAYTVGAASPISAALAICGGVNVFASIGLVGSVSAEAVLAAAPDAVLYSRTDENPATIAAYWARLPGVPAVREHNLIAIDADLLARPGPRMIAGIDAVCTALDQARAHRP